MQEILNRHDFFAVHIGTINFRVVPQISLSYYLRIALQRTVSPTQTNYKASENDDDVEVGGYDD